MYRRIRKLLLNYIPDVARTGILCAMPSLYPAFEIKPSSCNIMLTNRCNLRCVMCGQWRQKPREELKTEDWKKIMDDLRRNGFRNIHFTGGEPLLRKDLNELVSYCNKAGFTVGMTTNGVLLDSGALNALIDSGLRSVALSVDALGECYEHIRGISGSFDKLKIAASAVAEAKASRGIDAYINFTLMKGNIELFESVKEFADSAGLPVALCLLDKTSAIFRLQENEEDFWIGDSESIRKLAGLIGYLKSEMASKPGSLILSYPGVDFISGYFDDPCQKNVPCVVSQDSIYVDPYGDVYGGCLSMGIFGNLGEMRFGDIKDTKRYSAAKKDMFYKKCAGCSCGYLFNMRHVPGLIIKDISQRISAACKKSFYANRRKTRDNNTDKGQA